MDNIVFTQLSIAEFKQLLRQEVASCLASYLEANTTSPTDKKPLLTIAEAAELVNLSKSTLYSLCSKGEIPYIKKRKRLYFSEKELLDWLNSGRQKTNSQIQQEVNYYMAPNTRRRKE